MSARRESRGGIQTPLPEMESTVKYSKVAAVAAGTVMAMGAAAPAFASSDAGAIAAHSPGVLSGNALQIPLHIPINACGNTLNLPGLLNPAFGNACVNADER